MNTQEREKFDLEAEQLQIELISITKKLGEVGVPPELQCEALEMYVKHSKPSLEALITLLCSATVVLATTNTSKETSFSA